MSNSVIDRGETFLLDGQEILVVESGSIDLFSVRTAGGVPASRRRFIARFDEGSLVFPSGALPEGFGLLSVPVSGSTVRYTGWDSANDLARRIDEWIEKLGGGIFPELPPKDHIEPPIGAPLMLEAGAFVRSASGVVWLEHQEGCSHLMGREALTVEGGFAAVGRSVWLRTGEISRLLSRSTEDLVRDGAIVEVLEEFHLRIFAALPIIASEERRLEGARLNEKAASTQTSLGAALGHLSSIMAEERIATSPASDPLLEVCRLVGAACGIAVRSSSHENGRDRLGQIARESKFRVRKVALRGAWWKSDAGPLVALIVDGDSRSPVALLPSTSGTYSLVDPASGATPRLDAATNQRLHPFAYSFYRPFSDRALRAWDVFKFGAEQCRGDFLMILLMGIAGGLLGLMTPVVTGTIFNRVIPGAERIQLGHMIAALVVCALASAIFQLVRGLASLRIESRMDASVQSAVWDRLLNLPTSFFRQFAAGDLAVRAGGISAIRQLLSGATVSSLLSGLFSVFNLALLFYYDAGLAIGALLMTFAALLVMLGVSYLQLRYQRDVARVQSHLSGEVLQYITGITKLRVAGAESKAFERWARRFKEQRTLQFSARRVGNVLTTFTAVFPVVSMMLIFAMMLGREDALMPTGDFIAFSSAFGLFTSNMLAMTGAFVAILTAVPMYEQAKPILETLPETDESKSEPGTLTGQIEIERVSFRYEADGPAILNDVSVRARAGEFVAFVGPSGSGKSTILRLLLGFETPESGSIYYDGQDLAGLDVQSVRRQIGVVLQNGGLMSGDLFTNITGSAPATMDDAWEAARMAGFDEDIRQMPMGMHTVISEGASTLSGGQRQRLLIARAVVHRPRILYFDEATSALDNRTQAIVSESLGRLQATRIVVAHRLSTIIDADRIYVLDQGRVVQQGTYQSLLEDGGLFAELVRRQVA